MFFPAIVSLTLRPCVLLAYHLRALVEGCRPTERKTERNVRKKTRTVYGGAIAAADSGCPKCESAFWLNIKTRKRKDQEKDKGGSVMWLLRLLFISPSLHHCPLPSGITSSYQCKLPISCRRLTSWPLPHFFKQTRIRCCSCLTMSSPR